MLFHFLKHTLRIFSRSAIYTLINLFGLATGLTVGILILMFVVHELSYDRFHKNSHNLFLINMVHYSKDYSDEDFSIPAAIGPSLYETFPEILSFTRVRYPGSAYFVYENDIIQLKKVTWTDSTFFNNFSFKLLSGNPSTALASLYSVVLTEKTAGIIFGDEDPMGKTLMLNNAEQYTVTGVVENPPTNSSLEFDALLSFMTLYEDKELYMSWDGGYQYFNFLHFKPGINWQEFQEKLKPFLYEKINKRYEQAGVRVELKFEPFRSFHLRYGQLDSGISTRATIYIFSSVALLVLLIACFNFTNLSTARALTRAKETGIRKVAGATRSQLIRQFLAEALLMSFMAFGFSLFIIELVHPWYNAIIGIRLSLYENSFAWFLPSLFFLVFLTGILAGAYPAFFLSSLAPVKVLKGGISPGHGKANFSKALVVLQFVISVSLINITWTIFRQLTYIRQHNVGMNTKDVLSIYLPDRDTRNNFEALQHEIRNIAGVISCGAASAIPGGGLTRNGYRPDGYDESIMINVIDIDADFIETMGLEVLHGRNFIQGSASDQTSYLVNEAFVRQFNYSDPIGVKIKRDGSRPVIGVVKDFNFSSLHEPVNPLIFTNEPWQGFSYLLVRVNQANRHEVARQIEVFFRRFMPGVPFISCFVDDYLETSYSAERQFGDIFSWFTALGVLVACMGLFGLSSYLVQQRKKEIGLRKLVGASVVSVMKMVTQSFTWLVLIANFVALVPTIMILRFFLSFYSFSISISPPMFVYTAIGTLILAWLTVGWQSFRAATTNPVEVVKYE